MKIRYNNKIFNSYLDLLYYMDRIEHNIQLRFYPDAKWFNIKYLLEEKFNRPFSLLAIKQLVQDELAQGTLKLEEDKKEVNSGC